MINEIKENHSLVRILIILLIIATGSYVFSIAWGVLSKFLDLFVILLSAWLLSFILEPIVEILQKLKFPKIIATAITYLFVFVLLTVITIAYIPLITSQISMLTQSLPKYLQSAPPIVVSLNKSITGQINNSALLISSLAQFSLLVFITLILSFYFIIDRKKINQEFFDLVPKKWHSFLRFTQKTINETFVSFLRVQLFYGVSSGILTWLVLRAFNIDFAASIALMAGALAFVPLIGPFLALVPPVLLAFLIDPAKALIIGAILLVFQQITFNIVGPKLLGKAFSLHPAIILISFLIGMQFAGALGAVFAIPVLGISAVMIRRFGHYFADIKDETVEAIKK